MTNDDKFEFVYSYFNQVFLTYLIKDIESIQSIELTKERLKAGSCAAAMVLSILASMNQLGRLTSKKTIKEIETNPDTAVCIKEYCSDWMKSVAPIYNKSSIQDMLIFLFRHGMAHQFLPAPDITGLTRDPNQKQLLEKNPSDKLGRYVLNADILAEDMTKSLRILDEKIKKAKDTDHEFLDRFHRRLKNNIDKYSEKNRKIITSVQKNSIFQNSAVTTTISGTELKTTQTVDDSWAKSPNVE